MKQLKKITTILLLAVLATGTSFAQEKNKKKGKKHMCTEVCKEGQHMYACGEKGHKCTKACKKAMKKHGEDGHVCGAECKKAMKKKM